MAQTHVTRPAFAMAMFLASLVIAVSPAFAQSNELVVQVSTRLILDEPAFDPGTGIIVANDGQTATIVTAAHVVDLRGQLEVSPGELENTKVRFYRAGREEWPARLLFIDPQLDLAVLSVPSNPELAERFAQERDVLMPAQLPLRLAEDKVTILGTRDGVPWSRSERPAPLIAIGSQEEPGHILFDSDIASPGFSGGPLFTESGAFIGMVIEAGLADAAINLDVIREQLAAARLPFDLQVNDELVARIAVQILSRDRDRTASLVAALSRGPIDYSRLHLEWLAKTPPHEIAAALREESDNEGETAVERFFELSRQNTNCRVVQAGETEAADFERRLVAYGMALAIGDGFAGACDDHLGLWLRQIAVIGVDPDMRVQTAPSNNNGGQKSLLYIALDSSNATAAIALLDAGASPNPYVELAGNGSPRLAFLYPLNSVLDNFEGATQDLMWEAMVNADSVVIGDVRDAGERVYGLAEDKIPNEQLCERLEDRYSFAWCTWAEDFDMVTKFRSGVYSAIPVTFITANEDTGYFYAHVIPQQGREMDGILEVSRDYSEINAYWYGDNYGCRPNPRDNNESFTSCWRAYPGILASYERPAPTSGGSVLPDLSNSTIGQMEVEGLSLAMGLKAAHELLIARGFTQQTIGDPLSTAGSNRAVTVDYYANNRTTDRSRVQVNLTAWNMELISILIEQRGSVPNSESWSLSPVGTLPNETFRSYRPATELSRHDSWGRLMIVEELLDGFTAMVQHHKASESDAYGNQETLLVRRANDETDAQRSWFQSKVGSWLATEMNATSGACIDDYWRLRYPAGSSCESYAERASSFMQQNATNRNVHQVSPFIQYEILEEGSGRQLRDGDQVNFVYQVQKLDFEPSSERDRGILTSGGREATVGEPAGLSWFRNLYEVLPYMKMGSTFRLYSAPTFEFTPWESSVIVAEVKLYRFSE